MPLHVAVDARFAVLDERGIGRYARAVLARLLREPELRLSFVVPGMLAAGRRARIARALGVGRDAVTAGVPRDAAAIFNPSNATDLPAQAPQVTMIHDAAPFAFPAADPRVRAREQAPFLRTAQRAALVLVQSNFTAQEVHARLGVPVARMVVAPLGCDPAFSPQGGGPPEAVRERPYLLHVGAHDERKNTATLVAAYERAFPGQELRLLFTRTPPRLPAGALVAAAPDDTALAALYRGAAAVVVPSTYEGFGLPLLEALASGAPALAARAGALPEVGGDAAAYVDAAHDPGAWAHALRTLLGDQAELRRLRAAGPARAALFSWDRCAAHTLAALREVASRDGA